MSKTVPVSSEMLKRMDKLFLHFGAMYGFVWTKRFNNEEHLHFCKKQWAIALANVSDLQIKNAIDLCLREKNLPPSLPEFKQLCRQYAAAYHQPVQRCLPQNRNDAVARKNLAVIRVMLGLSPKENFLC